MSIFSWNKKALAGIASVTLLGAMSPIAAVAEDMGPSSVTYTVDLNDGGGGGGVICPTQSTFTVDPGASRATYLGVTEGLAADRQGFSQHLYYGPDGQQDDWYYQSNGDTWLQDDFNEWERNKKRSFAFTPLLVTFDADGCEASTLSGAIFVERGPVLRANTSSGDWVVAEIRNDEAPGVDGYGEASNVGMANLFANTANMMGGLNYETPLWAYPLWRAGASLSSDTRLGDPYDNDPVADGANGEFRMQPRVDIFGADPTGVYKVTYDLYLEVQDTGLDNNGCWWFCY
jgi:hypothetical protein